jgi:uncharacterized protein (DUF1501 family)
MLTILGQSCQGTFCHGISRRGLLRIGGLAPGGLSMSDIPRAEAASGTGRSRKSVIMIYLPGGSPHQDIVLPQAQIISLTLSRPLARPGGLAVRARRG